MYFLIALAVGFGSVFLPSLISCFFEKREFSERLKVTVIFTALYVLFLWFCFWKSSLGLYGPTPLWKSIFFGAVISIIIFFVFDEDFSSCIPGILLVIGLIVWGFIVFITSYMSFKADEKAALIGEVEIITELEEVIEPADNTHICLVSRGMAVTSAQNALSQITLEDGAVAGSRYTIGEPVKQFVDGIYWWIFPLEFSGYWKWEQDKQIPGYLRVSAEDPTQQPQAVQIDKDGEEIHVKYLNSAYFEYNAKRYLRTNGFFVSILQDWTYEVDDNWRPYYTVSVVEKTIGFTGKVTKGIILLDIQTGDFEFYKIEDVPGWIDRVIPLEVIDYNASKWGLYNLADWWYTAFHDDKSQQPTPGWFLTYNGDQCQWFTGFTSTNSADSALTGFMLVNARTGKASYFKTSGVTEDLAYGAALLLWNNYSGYTTTELVPYNIYGYLTYIIPMQCNNQFSGVSLVCLSNINIKAKGDTLEQALQNYRSAIGGAGTTSLTPTSGMPTELEVTGIVERIGLPTMSTGSQIVSFKLVDVGKIFQITYSATNPESILLNVGDEIKIIYSETTEIVVSVNSFDIIGVELESGSVAQSKAVEEQKNTNEEVDRVDDKQAVQNIIDNGDLNGVDPEALQKFLEEQQGQQDNSN